MIELAATSASLSLLSRLPEVPSRGNVHSVFRSAVNLVWGDDGWMSLLGPPSALNPEGVLLPRLPRVARGSLVTVSRAAVSFPERSAWVRLDRARPRELGLTGTAAFGRGTARAFRALRGTLRRRSLSPGLLLGVLDRDWEGDAFLCSGGGLIEAAARSEDENRTIAHLVALVGLGSGLTPAGDDFLAGFLAASTLFDRAAPVRDILADELSEKARRRTTAVGCRMLLAACRGEFSAPVVDLVQALAQARGSVRREVDGLLCVGGSSGADVLAGILFCAEKFAEG